MSVCANQRLYIKEVREKFSPEQLKEWQDKTINTNRIFAFDHFGSMDNDEILSRVEHLASAKDCKWIIIDHLSILVSGQEVDDERKSIDILMTKLRKLVDLGHLRGSASIAQLSDSVIALERDQQADDPSLANVVKVRILKNRYCGTLGVACHLFYNKETGRIKQIQNPYSQTNDLSSTFDQAF
jgi:twinkle protein